MQHTSKKELFRVQELDIVVQVLVLWVLLANVGLFTLSLVQRKRKLGQAYSACTLAVTNILSVSVLIDLALKALCPQVKLLYNEHFHMVVELIGIVGYEMHALLLIYMVRTFDKPKEGSSKGKLWLVLLWALSILLASIPLIPEVRNLLINDGERNSDGSISKRNSSQTGGNEENISAIMNLESSTVLYQNVINFDSNRSCIAYEYMSESNMSIKHSSKHSCNETAVTSEATMQNPRKDTKIFLIWILAEHSWGWQFTFVLEIINLSLHTLAIIFMVKKFAGKTYHGWTTVYRKTAHALLVISGLNLLQWFPVLPIVLLGFGIEITNNDTVIIWVYLLSQAISGMASPVIYFIMWKAPFHTSSVGSAQNLEMDDFNSDGHSPKNKSERDKVLSQCFKNKEELSSFDAVTIISSLWADVSRLHKFGMVASRIDLDHIYISRREWQNKIHLKCRLIGTPVRVSSAEELDTKVQANKDSVRDLFDKIMTYVRTSQKAVSNAKLMSTKSWRFLSRSRSNSRSMALKDMRSKTLPAKNFSRKKTSFSHNNEHKISRHPASDHVRPRVTSLTVTLP